jgi:hypothetical protein
VLHVVLALLWKEGHVSFDGGIEDSGGMVWYGMVWYVMVWYVMVWYSMLWCGIV